MTATLAVTIAGRAETVSVRGMMAFGRYAEATGQEAMARGGATGATAFLMTRTSAPYYISNNVWAALGTPRTTNLNKRIRSEKDMTHFFRPGLTFNIFSILNSVEKAYLCAHIYN